MTSGPSGLPRPQDSRSVPAPAVSQAPEEDLRGLSLEELLSRQPGVPWLRSEGRWTLEPAVRELQRRVDSGTLTDDQWRTLLTGRVIHTRPRWPVGEPLLLWIQEPAWLPYASIALRAIEPELGAVTADNRTPSRCATCAISDSEQQRRLRMAPLPPGTHRVRVDVTIEQTERERFGRGESHLVWRGELTLPIEAVDSVELAMPPCSVPEVTADLRRSLRIDPLMGPDGARHLVVHAGGTYERFPALRGMAVTVLLQVRYRGEVREEVRITNDRRSPAGTRDLEGFDGSELLEHVTADLADEGFDTTDWELSVTGVPDGVLPIWETDRWWNGSFSMPLAEALRAPEDR